MTELEIDLSLRAYAVRMFDQRAKYIYKIRFKEKLGKFSHIILNKLKDKLEKT